MEKYSKPLFVQTSSLRPIRITLVPLVAAFFLVISTAFFNPLFIEFALVFGFLTGVATLIIFLALLFSEDCEFHDDFLKIKELARTRVIRYWDVEYIVNSLGGVGKGKEAASAAFSPMKLRIRSTGEHLIIKSNPYNQKIRSRLDEFLRKKTSPRFLFT